jgi:arginyl-tRNA synthetase
LLGSAKLLLSFGEKYILKLMAIKKELEKLIRESAKKAFGIEVGDILIEKPTEEKFGDFSTNLAMVLASQLKKNPLELAENLKKELEKGGKGFFQKIETAPPGFLNFFLSQKLLKKGFEEILTKREKFGESEKGKGKKVNIEFVSANPTGPLTLGNGRGGFCADALGRVLEKSGYKVIREYYINDRGEQIKSLGYSVLGNEKGEYRGEYIGSLRKKIKETDVERAGKEAAELILKEMIKPALEKMGISFDVWFSESSLYESGETEKTLDILRKTQLVYKKEGALYFKSTKFGDEKDRVLIKKNGESTYFLSDIAYLKNKFERGFDLILFFWGADHHGYVKRMKGAASALGYEAEKVHFILFQLVRLFQGGKEIRMSKRKGVFVTLEELIEEVGVDAARFFFLTKKYNTHLDFNLDLAKEQSERNPVYYVQYAYARMSSILRKIKFPESELSNFNFELLHHPSEQRLVKKLLDFPGLIEEISTDFEVHRLPHYALSLAKLFHQFYTECKVLTEDKELRAARLALLEGSRIVLGSTLFLMGISAPERM